MRPDLQTRLRQTRRTCRRLSALVILALACHMAGWADSLTLRNGQVVKGTYMGGTARTVKMQVGDTIKSYDVTGIASLEFTAPARMPPPEPKAQPHPAASGRPAAATPPGQL